MEASWIADGVMISRVPGDSPKKAERRRVSVGADAEATRLEFLYRDARTKADKLSADFRRLSEEEFCHQR